MNNYPRKLDLVHESRKKSIMLFGPRQTGKTSLLRKKFPKSAYYDLLDSDLFFRLSQQPSLIREECAASDMTSKSPVIIDEIQKLPLLLDEVHLLIESMGLTFILTGSSPRKLRHGAANLLGGRARTRYLFPLCSSEIDNFNLNRVLNYGSIPSIYLSDEPRDDLRSYCGNYLKEEIQNEGAVRRIENFSRFLSVAGLVNGELVNFSSLANDVQLPHRTVVEYFRILEDTLIGTMVPPFRRTIGRKPISTAKFYFFDVGVANCLAKRGTIAPGSELFGKALEHFIFTELRSWLEYSKDERDLCFYRDVSGAEIDFVVGDDLAIEVKASTSVTPRHIPTLMGLPQTSPFRHRIVVSRDRAPRKIGNVEILPVEEFCRRLWGGVYK